MQMERKVAAKLIETLPTKLQEQMRDKGLMVEVVAKTEAAQRDFEEAVKRELPRAGGCRACTATSACSLQ